MPGSSPSRRNVLPKYPVGEALQTHRPHTVPKEVANVMLLSAVGSHLRTPCMAFGVSQLGMCWEWKSESRAVENNEYIYCMLVSEPS